MQHDNNTDGMSMLGGRGKRVTHTAALAAYNPLDHQGALVPPMVDASTYAYRKAEEGEYAFGCAYGLSDTVKRLDPHGNRQAKHIYARLSTPSVTAAEQTMLALEPGADWCFLFPSGMGALSTLLSSCCHLPLRPCGGALGERKRDVVVHSTPVYGGTHALFYSVSKRYGITNVPVDMNDHVALAEVFELYNDRIGLVFIESPANPTISMVDIPAVARMLVDIFGDERPTLAVDNTFAGVFQHPIRLGVDVVHYSATKYLGGHMDLMAGFLLGKTGRMTTVETFEGKLVEAPLMNAVRGQRTIHGYTPSSEMAHKLTKHMQTYRLRMEHQAQVATRVAHWLVEHEKVADVRFPTLLSGDAKALYETLMSGPSAMIAFTVKGDKDAAYRFLDALKLIPRAVSLGGVRTLANHPATWTHSDIPSEHQLQIGITPGLIRMSIGIEEPEDLIADLKQALETV